MEPEEEPGPLGRALTRVTSRPLLGVVLGLYWLSCLVLLADHYRHLPEGPLTADGHIPTGDFIAFDTGALLVAEGKGRDLYDLEKQEEVETRLAGRPVGLYPFAYPASFAVVLSPLAKLPYRTAALAFEGVNLALGLAAALLLAPTLPKLREKGPIVLFLAAAGFQPLMRVWLQGGQTTVITFAILALATFGLATDRSLLLGLAIGLLGYKPQLLLPALLCLVAWRSWQALGVAALVGVLHWPLGAIACGVDWPLKMLRTLARYRELESASNYGTHVSFLAAFERFGTPGHILALVLVLGTLGLLVFLATRAGDRKLAWAFAVSSMLLVSPHAQFYDVGLLVLPILLLLEGDLARGREPSPLLRGLLVLGYFGYSLYDQVPGFQPLVLWPIAVCAWAFLRARAR